MSERVPKDIRDQIQRRLWAKADDLKWSKLSDSERTNWYENWTKERDIGETLSHFMDPRRVRVYIKDSLLKPYIRAQLGSELERVMVALGIDIAAIETQVTYSKPHGRRLDDGRVVCWGSSRDWKAIVISVFERAYQDGKSSPYAAVFVEGGKTMGTPAREMICEAGRRLGLQKIIWLD